MRINRWPGSTQSAQGNKKSWEKTKQTDRCLSHAHPNFPSDASAVGIFCCPFFYRNWRCVCHGGHCCRPRSSSRSCCRHRSRCQQSAHIQSTAGRESGGLGPGHRWNAHLPAALLSLIGNVDHDRVDHVHNGHQRNANESLNGIQSAQIPLAWSGGGRCRADAAPFVLVECAKGERWGGVGMRNERRINWLGAAAIPV